MQGFLDELPFVKHRLYSVRAVDDPFLTEVTADGIPIDAASTVDLRLGNVRYVGLAKMVVYTLYIVHTYSTEFTEFTEFTDKAFSQNV